MLNNLDDESKAQSQVNEDILGGRSELRVSNHALREAHKEGLRGKDIINTVLNGALIECYPNRRRVLIAGEYKNTSLPIHVVCDYTDLDVVVVVTVYIPNRWRWAHPLRRRPSTGVQ